MQQLIQHPSYPGHFLSSFQYKNGFTCNGCGEDGHGKGFRCVACNLDLHTSCATGNMAEEKVIQHPSHPGYCLRYVRYSHAFICNGCKEHVLGNGYRCAACDFDLHISCATVKMAEEKVIQHPSHPGHWLSYVRYPSGYECDGCGEPLRGNGYNCAACNFDLHECCATAPPVLDQSFYGGNGKWVHFQMRAPGGSQMQCSDCSRIVSGFGYYCTRSSCEYALHPTCALLPRRHTYADLPRQPGERQIIRHPSHTEHSLNYVRYPDGICTGTGIDAVLVILICMNSAPQLLQFCTRVSMVEKEMGPIPNEASQQKSDLVVGVCTTYLRVRVLLQTQLLWLRSARRLCIAFQRPNASGSSTHTPNPSGSSTHTPNPSRSSSQTPDSSGSSIKTPDPILYNFKICYE